MKLNVRACLTSVAADVRRRSSFTFSPARSAYSCLRLLAKRIFKSALGLFGLAGVLGLSSGTHGINPVLGTRQEYSEAVGAPGPSRLQNISLSADLPLLAIFADSSIRTSFTQIGSKGVERTSDSELGPILRPVRSLHLLDLPPQRVSLSVGIDERKVLFVPAHQSGLSGFQLLSLVTNVTTFDLIIPQVLPLGGAKRTSNDQLAPLLRPRRSFHLLDLQHQLNSDSLGK